MQPLDRLGLRGAHGALARSDLLHPALRIGEQGSCPVLDLGDICLGA